MGNRQSEGGGGGLRKIVIIFLSISLNISFGFAKNRNQLRQEMQNFPACKELTLAWSTG